MPSILLGLCLGVLALSSQGNSQQIVVEWSRIPIPQPQPNGPGLGALGLDPNGQVLGLGGWKVASDTNLYVSLGKLWSCYFDNEVQNIVEQHVWGDSSHAWGAIRRLFSGNQSVMVGPRHSWQRTVRQWNDSARIALLYLNENQDSIDFLEFGNDRPNIKEAFLNDDGAVDVFSVPWQTAVYTLFKIGSDRRTIREISYEAEVPQGQITTPRSFKRLRNGDFMLTSHVGIERWYGDRHEIGRAGCIFTMNPEGETNWFDMRLDSVPAPIEGRFVFNWFGDMNNTLEHSSGAIYAIGNTDYYVNDTTYVSKKLMLYKYDADWNFEWRKVVDDNYGINSRLRFIYEVRPDLLAVFGDVYYRQNDDRTPGFYAALFDTSGELLTDTLIRGEGFDETDSYLQVLQVEPTRFLMLVNTYPKRTVSIRFDLDSANTVAVEPTATPSAYALNSAYPNPFNSSTRISFDLPYRSDVRLSIYDLSGREVATLVTGELESGSHSATWNAQGSPAGVYLLALKAGRETMTQKVVLLP